MDSSNERHVSAELQQDDPGAYQIPFRTYRVELGRRLDSIPPSLRYWATSEKRANAPWHKEMVEANSRYEEWLSTRPPGEYPVPFCDGKRIDEIKDSLRYWGVSPDRSSSPWYNFFVRANARYEQHLTATQSSGEFSLPRGSNVAYAGVPLAHISQDEIWRALRPSNRHQNWYQELYDANKHFLDDVYKSRSPGSEPIWFGRKYRGLRLDQVYEHKGFMRWCFDPQRSENGWLNRFKDLVNRFEDWRAAHPERCSPRQQRNSPDIQNPVGEAIGPSDDSLGSADENEHDKDSFVQSDSGELEYSSGSDSELSDDSDLVVYLTADSDGPTGSSVEITPSRGHTQA